jgi:hypothetical protein
LLKVEEKDIAEERMWKMFGLESQTFSTWLERHVMEWVRNIYK